MYCVSIVWHGRPFQGGGNDGDEMAALESRLEAAELPPEARKVATRDFARLKKMQPSQPEYTV